MMKRFLKRALKYILILCVVLFVVGCLLSIRKTPDTFTYGVSFSKFHSDELGINWKDAYTAILDDLGVRHFRLSAHWPMVEPEQNVFDWSVLDQQMNMARDRGADVILVVGRRTPGWPECHTPEWADELEKQDGGVGAGSDYNKALDAYITAVVNRYKDYPNLKMWQVENEPFLSVFATAPCATYDPKRLPEEIDMVHKLDPNHKVLVTDSGEISTWYSASHEGDEFGTSIYLYIWQHAFGPMRYPIGPWFFRIKQNLLNWFVTDKHPLAIEVQAEPWLLTPIASAPIDEQLKQMNIDRFKEIVDFVHKASFSEQYYWGAEWWYYMKQNGHPEFWDFAKTLYKQ